MGRNGLILQPFGLGDCIFSQGIVKQLGFNVVIWPVMEQYLEQLQEAYPSIIWCRENMSNFSNLIDMELIAVPIRWSDTIESVEYRYVMRAKYDMYRLDFKEWAIHASWRRNAMKEIQLMNELGIDHEDKFNLVSMNYSTKFKSRPLEVNNGLRNIYLNPINGYSLFDWARVMEMATEIHFVSSSSLYMLECLKLKAERICIYQRSIDEPHNRYDYLFSNHKYNWL